MKNNNTQNIVHIPHGFLQGEITAPASKSDLIRAIFSAALFTKKTTIQNPNYCSDVLSAINVIETFGSQVIKHNTEIVVHGKFQYPQKNIDCGESGLCIRIASMLAMYFDKPITIIGKGTALKRNFSDIINTVKLLGGKIIASHGKLPFEINGTVTSFDISINGNQTSQTITGLIFLFLKLNQPAQLIVSNPVSVSYLYLTKEVLSMFKQNISIKDCETKNLRIDISKSYQIQKLDYKPTIDWSGIAFFLVGAAINGNIRFKNLAKETKHSDAIILDFLVQANVNIIEDKNDLIIKKSIINRINVDITNFPDLFPPLVILSLFAKDICTIKGIHRLINKESNRLETLTTELTKLGAIMSIENDTLHIQSAQLKSGKLSAMDDHRIAMAMAILSTSMLHGNKLNNSTTINKSFPDFLNQLFKLLTDVRQNVL